MKEQLKELIKEKVMSESMNLDRTIEYVWSLKEDGKPKQTNK